MLIVADQTDVDHAMTPTIMFVVTTPFAVNAFLAVHLEALAKSYRIVLCTNLEAYQLLPIVFRLAEVRHIPFARKVKPWVDLKTLLLLCAVVHDVKPMCIHSITPKAGLLAMTAGFFHRVPNRWHTFTGQVWATRQWIQRCLLKAFDRLIVRLATNVFSDSASQCRLLVREGVVREDGVAMMGTGSIAGVDLKKFQPDEENRDRFRQRIGATVDACVFLYVGRLAKDKGVFDLVRAFKQLAVKEPNVELWFVGPDDEGLLNSLQSTACGCEAQIRWLGATPNPECFMAAADVLMLPSYREGFGSVIIEGAACGLPSIAYSIDGVIDAVIDGHTGLMVEVGDLDALEGSMQALVQDKKMRGVLGRQAMERAVNAFSSQAVTEAWLSYYRKYLG